MQRTKDIISMVPVDGMESQNFDSKRPGWPWTADPTTKGASESPGDHDCKISIVTTSLNQGQFIEETIRSVLLQNYPNIEYIIIDGGSTDKTLDIISKYGRWLANWTSEPDQGQSHALNKGFARATGDIFAFINSDDYYAPGAFQKIAQHFNMVKKPQLLAGSCKVIQAGREQRQIDPWWPENLSYFLRKTFSSTFAQPAAFWSREIFERVGGFSQELHYCFDREFFLKIGLEGVRPVIIDETLAYFREHSDSKTSTGTAEFHRESILLLECYANRCRITDAEKKTIRKQMQNEIRYLDVFGCWRSSGRVSAMLRFLAMISRSPLLLKERKILGQARRLLSFPAEKVVELN